MKVCTLFSVFFVLCMFVINPVVVFAATIFSQNNPPAPVAQFYAIPAISSMTLSWVTPDEIDLAQYDVRYSSVPINAQNFQNVTQISGTPVPLQGQNQNMIVSGLNPNTQYYFGIIVTDTIGQESVLVTVSGTTLQNGGGGGGNPNPPMPVNNIIIDTSSSALVVHWFTPNDGTLSEFTIRYSTTSITAQNFSQGIQINTPLPIPNSTQSVILENLSSNTLYYIGIVTKNIFGNESLLVVASTTTSFTVPGVINFTATPVSQTAITLSWNTPTSTLLSQFDVRYDTTLITNQNFTSATMVQNIPFPLSGYSQNITISGLVAGTTYFFGIKIISTVGEQSTLVTTSIATNANPPSGGGGEWGPGTGYYYILNNSSTATPSLVTSTISHTNISGTQASYEGQVITIPLISYPNIIMEEGSVQLIGKFFITPTSTILKNGDTISLVFNIDAGVAQAYGARIVVQYPKDIVKLQSIIYGDGWVPTIFSSGETSGVIVRTGTYPKGWTGEIPFMTITLQGISDGEGDVSFLSGEDVIDGSGKIGKVILGEPAYIVVTKDYFSDSRILLGNLIDAVFSVRRSSFIFGILAGIFAIALFFGFKKFSSKDV